MVVRIPIEGLPPLVNDDRAKVAERDVSKNCFSRHHLLLGTKGESD